MHVILARTWALACACLLVLGWAHAADTYEHTLANGLKVIVKPDRRAPVVVSQLWYRAGSMDESYGLTGVAHVLEHMMFKGTRSVPEGEFSRRIAAAGGRENAFTSRDATVYHQTLPAERLALALELEADRMSNLTLAPEAFARELKVVMEERRLRTEDNPQGLLYEALMATAFQSHPYRHPVIGWMEDLRQMRVEDASAWYARWYAPNNAVLVVVGDVEPAAVFALAERYFGAIPARPLPARRALAEAPQRGPRTVTVRAPARLPAAYLSWPVPKLERPAEDWEPYALEVLEGVLDGHASARLPRALVQEGRVAVGVSAGYDPVGRGPALFLASVTAAEGRTLDEAVAALKAEIARLAREGVGEAELARVKAQILAAQVYERDSLFFQAREIGEWETAGLDHRARGLRIERLRQVTPEQVQAVAARYLVDDRLTLAQLVPLPLAAEPARTAPDPAADVDIRHVR
ncbi:MAG: insulinase family protein [Thiobacillaceae bacterium]|nr:insulinase family protein [Thiobacillaceae bacterium]